MANLCKAMPDIDPKLLEKAVSTEMLATGSQGNKPSLGGKVPPESLKRGSQEVIQSESKKSSSEASSSTSALVVSTPNPVSESVDRPRSH